MLLKVGFLLSLPLLLLATLLFKDGLVVLDFTSRDEGRRIFLPVPVSLVNFGIQMLPDRKVTRATDKLQPYEQYLEAVTDELMEIPDVKFVEIDTPREQIHVAKLGNNIVVDVDTQDEKIHVSVPIRGLKKVIRNLAEAAE